jgi:ABC-type transport system involved in cytochrome bd biosynthesis fused ATPase/permease subunit
MLRQSTRSKDEKVVIRWKDICFDTVVKDPSKSSFFHTSYKTKQVLCNMSGRAASGELLAIIGPTGTCFSFGFFVLS